MIEHLQEAAETVLGPFKNMPLVLALVMMNFALLGYQFWDGNEVRKQRNDYVNQTQKILADCVSVQELERLQRLK